MGVILTRLQRVLPVLKEQMKTIESLQNQDLINQQKIAILEDQKALLEQNVGQLSSELTRAEIVIQELRVHSKRLVIFGGFCALGAWLYIRKLDHDLHNHEECHSDDGDDGAAGGGDVVEVPDSLECIVCMEHVREVLLEPCGHVCLCHACAEMMRLPSGRVKCPVCRIRAETRTVFIT